MIYSFVMIVDIRPRLSYNIFVIVTRLFIFVKHLIGMTIYSIL